MIKSSSLEQSSLQRSYLQYKFDYSRLLDMESATKNHNAAMLPAKHFANMIGGSSYPYEAMIYNVPALSDNHTLKTMAYANDAQKQKKKGISANVIAEFNAQINTEVGGVVTAETEVDVTKPDVGAGIPGITKMIEYGIRTGSDGVNRVLVITGTILIPGGSDKLAEPREVELIMGSMTIVNNIPTQKRFHLYTKYALDSAPLILSKTTFQGDDATFLQGDIDLKVPLSNGMVADVRYTIDRNELNQKIRQISLTLMSISFPEIMGVNQITIGKKVQHLNNIMEFIKQINVTYAKAEYAHCQKALEPAPVEFKRYPKVYQSVVSTICNNIYYHYAPAAVSSIIKAPNVLKLITDSELSKILPVIRTWDERTWDEHMQDIPKILPSTLENKNILFKNGAKKYVTLSGPMRVIFDSGNSTVTSIGRNVVDELGLEVTQGCMMISVGVGGKNKTCGDYVTLNFKFSPTFSNAINKEYQILAFVDDATLKNTVLFGHANGLDLLFADNYSIKGAYSKSDPRSKESESARRQIIDEHVRLNRILDLYLSNPTSLENKRSLLGLRTINQQYIHAYQTGINEDNFAQTFEKLRECRVKVKKDAAFAEKPLSDVLIYLNGLIKNE